MAVSANYPVPVQVNGYTCHNCTEVGEAQKHIDPAHPKAGPFGVDAKNDPTLSQDPTPAVQFGGALSGTSTFGSSRAQPSWTASAVGARVDLSA